MNVQTGECTVSPEYAIMLGYEPSHFQETHAAWRERLHPDDRGPVTAVYEEYIAGRRKEYRVEFRQKAQSGEWKWILSVGAVMSRTADGQALRMLGTHTDITGRKRAEETVQRILDGIAPRTGPEFFRVLVDYLCEVCEVEFAFVGAIDAQKVSVVRTIAVSRRGQAADNFTYDLRDTPCERVVGQTVCSYPSGVQQAFPHDAMLVEMCIDGYLGTPLWSSRGQPIGLLVLLHNRSMPSPEQAEILLTVVAARAAAELERQMADAALRESESRLRNFVENARSASRCWTGI